LTIASQPVFKSSKDISSDRFDESVIVFVDNVLADLAENIYVHYKTCNCQNAS